MPRKRPLPQREKQICARIIEFREARGFSRADVARAMGISQFTLANIERQQSPLKFSMGYNFCLTYDLCLRWLATGRQPMATFTWISQDLLASLGGTLLFSRAFDQHLVGLVEAELRNLADAANVAVEELGQAGMVKSFPPIGTSRGDSVFQLATNNLRNLAATLDDESKLALARRVNDLLGFGHRPEQEDSAKKKDNLDSGKPSVIVSGMRADDVPTWSELKKTIARLTAGHGQKAALADKFGVSRQVLGNWLSNGKQGAPNAELTLRLFKWSLDPKRQAK